MLWAGGPRLRQPFTDDILELAEALNCLVSEWPKGIEEFQPHGKPSIDSDVDRVIIQDECDVT
jgi:hypothetical protein